MCSFRKKQPITLVNETNGELREVENQVNEKFETVNYLIRK